ncbi:MAG: radical SAM protein [Candidatus Heimdallarchaeota archaeon]|nr:radical SAM protein [Candidatus Heimdallarchaeota archaeon]MCK5049216.1 radical SAM protein [Candidatus Heimdallarchaeota archaeon]
MVRSYFEKSDSWENTELKVLKHYKSIMAGEREPRYRFIKSFPVDFDPEADFDQLQLIHSQTKEDFAVHFGEGDLSLQKIPFHQSYLGLKAELVTRIVQECFLCERNCGVNRLENELGVCNVPKEMILSTAFLHMGEEAPLVPSGTIFFYGCTFKCVFCQNYDISQKWQVASRRINRVSPQELAVIARELHKKGARNINYVGGDPTSHLMGIIKSLEFFDSSVSLLWNSNMGLSDLAMELIVDLFDLWLPDFKYGNNECGKKFSLFGDYFDVVARNLKKIYEKGSKETIIRHLIMPNHVNCCSKPILEWISENVPVNLVNVMGQYRPQFKVPLDERYSEINRRPTFEEIEEVRNYATELGLKWKSVS